MQTINKAIQYDLEDIAVAIKDSLRNKSVIDSVNTFLDRAKVDRLFRSHYSESELLELVKSIEVSLEKTCNQEVLNTPHPTRVIDYNYHHTVFEIQHNPYYKELLHLIANKSVNYRVIELFLIETSRRTNREIHNLFIDLAPVIIDIRKAPYFTIDKSAAREIDLFDIRDNIDTQFVQLPCKECYFHFPHNQKYYVYDSETGEHTLDGFYCFESSSNTVTYTDEQLSLYGIDSSKPYRNLTVVFTGQPKGTIVQDTLYRFDLLLQDGLTIGELMNHTTDWVNREHCGDSLEEGTITTEQEDANSIAPRNIQLVSLMARTLAYVAFAGIRKTIRNERTKSLEAVNRKQLKKQKKARQKVAGKYDAVVISTSNTSILSTFEEVGESNRAGPSKRPHFRRGFLRNQPYGSHNNPTYKPLYIAPVIVNENKQIDAAPKNYKVK